MGADDHRYSAHLRLLLRTVAGKEYLSHATILECCFSGLRLEIIVLGLKLVVILGLSSALHLTPPIALL